MFLHEVEAVVETRIVGKYLLRKTVLLFYRNTHEAVLLLFY